ncbi:MAG: response regulator [Candidatus Wallbacteria bacterium]|nr:response regulator [Candidatus Wallbacteria bacterium]
MRILLVEDNRLNRVLARDILQRRGHEVVEAQDLDSARSALGADAVDLVLLDIRVPGGGGEALLAEIRALPAHAALPVVAVTAQAMAGDRERLLAAGFDGYIAKPISTRSFAADVEAIAERVKGCPSTSSG